MQMAKRSLLPGGKLIINEVCLFTIKVALESLIAVFLYSVFLSPYWKETRTSESAGNIATFSTIASDVVSTNRLIPTSICLIRQVSTFIR